MSHRYRLGSRLNVTCRAMLSLGLGAATLCAQAQQTAQRVEVTGGREPVPITRITQDVKAAPASTTVLDRRDLDRLPISTYGDIFRNLTGFNVSDYGQGTVAYEIKLRGFNSGHGRDIAFTLDGVPLNITGSQHTNGYADLALVIAETVDRVEVIRGPFSTAAGNHAVAGSVNFFTDRNVGSMVKLDVDQFGRTRVLPIYGGDVGPGRLLLAVDATQGDGYNDQSDLERTNIFARYSLGVGPGQLSLRLQHYDAEADAPGYIDLASVQSGALSSRAALAPGIGDAKRQTNVVVNYRSDDPEGAGGWATGWQASLYNVDDDRRRYAFFDLNTPPGSRPNIGAERDQLTQRGFDLRKATMLGSPSLPMQLLVGLQYNDEKIEALNFGADADRNFLGNASVNADRDVETRTTAGFADLQISPLKGLKLRAGVRWDSIRFKVDLKPLDNAFGGPGGNSFSETQDQLSPKLGLAYALVGGANPVELYANAARGLKSPYPYGDFNRLPQTNITPLDSYEVGLQGSVGASRWRVAAWQTKQDKEALFDAANRFIGEQKTDRDGFDLEGRLALGRDISLVGNYSYVKARLRDAGSNDRITNVPDWTAGLGIEGVLSAGGGRVEWSLIGSITGPQPLLADNSARSKTYHRVTARAAYSGVEQLKGFKFALATTWYSDQFQEPIFDFGGGQFGVTPKPTWKTMATAQYSF